MTDVHTPDWVKSAVFYQIFPDRFARSRSVVKPNNLEPWMARPSHHGFKGGDLIGVVERLDYLQDLGVSAIYFCPVFQSTANHRYHTHDYFQVDPILGGNDALRRLLDEAHRRGMRVVLDGVFNHASRGFYQFNHLLENGPASPYVDWFTVHGWPLHAYEAHIAPNYAAWWGLHALPKLNTAAPAVREFLWQAGQYWIEQGIDGWRLDVPNEIDDDDFWREFRCRVKGANPEAYIVGEIWDNATRWLQGDQFDAVMNYLITRACLGFFAHDTFDEELVRGTGYGHVPLLNVIDFADRIDAILALYPQEITQAQLNLLGSHDTPRFLSLARGDASALRLALLFLMTYPGAPCIYYGDEIGMEGGRDPDCRRGFPWRDKDHAGSTAFWNVEVLNHARQAIALRHAHPTLCFGKYARLLAADDVYSFARYDEQETLFVVLNASRHTKCVDIPVAALALEDGTLQAIWGRGTYPVTAGFVRAVQVPPRAGLVLTSVTA